MRVYWGSSRAEAFISLVLNEAEVSICDNSETHQEREWYLFLKTFFEPILWKYYWEREPNGVVDVVKPITCWCQNRRGIVKGGDEGDHAMLRK